MKLSDTLLRTQQRNLAAENAKLRYELTQARLEAAVLREKLKASPSSHMSALWKYKAKEYRHLLQWRRNQLLQLGDENDRLRAELEAKEQEPDLSTPSHISSLWKQAAKMYRWSYHFQARILEEAGCYALTERSALRDQLATLTAERDEAVAMCKALQETLSDLLLADEQGTPTVSEISAAWSVVERTEEYLRRY